MENIDTPNKEDAPAVETTAADSNKTAVKPEAEAEAPVTTTVQTKKHGTVPAAPNDRTPEPSVSSA